MKGYLSPEQDGTGSVPIGSRAEVYRDPTDGHQVVVETDQTTATLGIADVTVSRKQDDSAPVVLRAQAESIEVRNLGNSNGVVVRTEGDTQEIEQGFSARVRRDAVIELGYQTELRLTVEREAKVEVSDGDYVAGDKVDNSTHIDDSVVNRSDIGSGEGEATVEDSVVNRSDVGSAESDETPTQNFCDRHQRTYTGPVCPDCAEGTQSPTAANETKFCLYCGESIPAQAVACPACGKNLE